MNTRISMLIAHKQVQPHLAFQRGLKIDPFFRRKDKVVFVVGPTGTGKSRLAIDLASRFPAEVVNCDKMQVYKGLDIVTNKVTEEECRGIPHHLLGIVDDPNADFTAEDFKLHASAAVDSIVSRDRVPVIAGGSNSFVEALANDDPNFRLSYECCFLWVDVSLPVLQTFVAERVDRMVKQGMLDESRSMFDPNISDYSKGIRRAIGVPEFDEFFRNESRVNAKTRAQLLTMAISKIKENTCKLASKQLQKIHRFNSRWNRNLHRIDATEVFLSSGEESDEKWETQVIGPSAMIVNQFLYEPIPLVPSIDPLPIPIPAMAAATR